jgi:hypothetical protein
MIYLQILVVILVLLLLIISAHVVGSSQTNDNNGLLVFENSTSGIRLQYPSNWTEANYTGPENLVTFIPLQKTHEKSLSQLTILTKNLSSQNKPLSAYVTEQINYLEHFLLDFDLIELGATTVAGHPAYRTLYTYKMPYVPGEYKSMEIWLTDGAKLYIISYRSEERSYHNYISFIESIINSLHIQ